VQTSVGTALSGLQRVAYLGAPRKAREMSWSLLPQAVALTEYADSEAPYATAESLWTEGLAQGLYARYYADASTRGASDFALYQTASAADPLERDGTYSVRWGVRLSLRRVTT
jgi:hypothetical protein